MSAGLIVGALAIGAGMAAVAQDEGGDVFYACQKGRQGAGRNDHHRRGSRLQERHRVGRVEPAGHKGRYRLTRRTRPTRRTRHTGRTGPQGDVGPEGLAGRSSERCAATLRWDLITCKSATIDVGLGAWGLGFDGADIWVAGQVYLSKIDPVTNTVTAVDVPSGAMEIAFDGTNIWATVSLRNGYVLKIDPVTNDIIANRRHPRCLMIGGMKSSHPRAVAFDGTNIWVTADQAGTVSKIDPVTNTVTATIAVMPEPRALAFYGTNIWVTGTVGDGVSKIDPVTNTVIATVDGAGGGLDSGLTFDGTHIWIISGDRTVSKDRPGHQHHHRDRHRRLWGVEVGV